MAEKKDVVTQVNPERAQIEARRGVQRDALGQIVRTNDWKKNRIAFLNGKIEDFASRTKNAKAEIKQLESELGK